MSDEGMKIDESNPNWVDVLYLVVFAIEQGVMTLKEYLDEYGDAKKFLFYLTKVYGASKLYDLTKDDPEFRNLYYPLAKKAEIVSYYFKNKSPAIVYVDERNGYTLGDLVCELIKNYGVKIKYLFSSTKGGWNYFIYFLDSLYEDSESNYSCFYDKAEEEGIFDELEEQKMYLYFECCENNDIEQIKLLLDFFNYSIEDLGKIYRTCLYYGINNNTVWDLKERLGHHLYEIEEGLLGGIEEDVD
ncbi:MAG: hypothetical protein ACTSQY_11075 [Candidatus Odinarchaeia archaeon]